MRQAAAIITLWVSEYLVLFLGFNYLFFLWIFFEITKKPNAYTKKCEKEFLGKMQELQKLLKKTDKQKMWRKNVKNSKLP